MRGEQSALSTLILAQLLPQLTAQNDGAQTGPREALHERARDLVDGED